MKRNRKFLFLLFFAHVHATPDKHIRWQRNIVLCQLFVKHSTLSPIRGKRRLLRELTFIFDGLLRDVSMWRLIISRLTVSEQSNNVLLTCTCKGNTQGRSSILQRVSLTCDNNSGQSMPLLAIIIRKLMTLTSGRIHNGRKQHLNTPLLMHMKNRLVL